MTEYARRALPWTLLGSCCALVVVSMVLVGRWPYLLWPLEGVAVGVLAAAGAWCVDEPAAAVVDTAPRSLRWRTAARGALGLLPVVGTWLTVVAVTSGALFGHALHVAGQGCVALLAGCALGTWGRSRGVPEPGRRIAAAAVPAAAFWALARPAEWTLPVFPYLESGPWSSSAGLWSLLGALAAALLAVSVAGGASTRRRLGVHPR